MSTWQLNERKKKFECHMKPKNQQENEEYNEDKKQQITLKEKKLKKKKKKEREERTWNSGRCAEGKDKKMRKSDKDLGQKSSVGQVKVLNEGLVGGHYNKTALRQFSPLAFPPDLGGKNLWARERNFSPGFSTPSIFHPMPNKRKPTFPPHFPSYIFHPS